MARYIGPSTKIARKFGEPIYGTDKDFEKRNFLRDSTDLQASARRNPSTALSSRRSRKLSILTAFSKDSSATLTRRRPA